MLVYSQSVVGADPDRIHIALDVTEASHQNFTDIAMLLPLLYRLLRKPSPLLGPIAPGTPLFCFVLFFGLSMLLSLGLPVCLSFC